MKIKTDFSELWEQVDRIVENRLLPENDMKKDTAYENVHLLDEVMKKIDDEFDKSIYRCRELNGYDEHLISLDDGMPSLKEARIENFSDEIYEETLRIKQSLNPSEIKSLAEAYYTKITKLFDQQKTLTRSVHESIKKDSNLFNHVQKNYPEIFSEYAHKFHMEWKPKLHDCLKNKEPLPKEYQSNKEAIMAYQHYVNSLIEYKVYSTFESKEQLDTMVNHATQLLENLEKPAINHELQSESSHEMEL